MNLRRYLTLLLALAACSSAPSPSGPDAQESGAPDIVDADRAASDDAPPPDGAAEAGSDAVTVDAPEGDGPDGIALDVAIDVSEEAGDATLDMADGPAPALDATPDMADGPASAMDALADASDATPDAPDAAETAMDVPTDAAESDALADVPSDLPLLTCHSDRTCSSRGQVCDRARARCVPRAPRTRNST